MITVSKTALHANISEYFRRVQEDGEVLMVTEDQVPVFKVVPLGKVITADEVFSDVRSKARFDDADLLAPETGEWEET